jgi:hypothetical protein
MKDKVFRCSLRPEPDGSFSRKGIVCGIYLDSSEDACIVSETVFCRFYRGRIKFPAVQESLFSPGACADVDHFLSLYAYITREILLV